MKINYEKPQNCVIDFHQKKRRKPPNLSISNDLAILQYITLKYNIPVAFVVEVRMPIGFVCVCVCNFLLFCCNCSLLCGFLRSSLALLAEKLHKQLFLQAQGYLEAMARCVKIRKHLCVRAFSLTAAAVQKQRRHRREGVLTILAR